jgi:putative FmdB family regulatory protein
MPIYEFKCDECGAISEFLIDGRSDSVSCRSCGSEALEKIMSAASFLAKTAQQTPGHTCCGRGERCETPPCSSGGGCRRD